MNIHMIVERPTDRLNWQYQLNHFRSKVDFTISAALPSLNYIHKDALSANDIIVIVLNDLEQMAFVREGISRLIKEVNIVAVITKECESHYGKALSEKILEAESASFSAIYFETAANLETFYQCLFKPRKSWSKGIIPPHLEDETVFIGIPESEVSEKREGRKLFNPSKEKISAKFGRKKRKPLSFPEKQPRMRICVHGKSSLVYELGAVLSSVSDQSVLVMDLDRMTPTADIYCGCKAHCKRKI